MERWRYPPPGQTITAVPVARSPDTIYGAIVGLSASSFPKAPGAPAAQRGIGAGV